MSVWKRFSNIDFNKCSRTGPTHRNASKFRRVPPGYPRSLDNACPKTATTPGIKGTSLPRSSDGGYPSSAQNPALSPTLDLHNPTLVKQSTDWLIWSRYWFSWPYSSIYGLLIGLNDWDGLENGLEGLHGLSNDLTGLEWSRLSFEWSRWSRWSR